MAKQQKTYSELTLGARIERILGESWIAPMYFNAAIAHLLEIYNEMSDDELAQELGGLVHPVNARAHIQEIYDKLNPA